MHYKEVKGQEFAYERVAAVYTMLAIGIVGLGIIGLYLLYFTFKLFYSLFINPKLQERSLRKHGIPGAPYNFFNGEDSIIMQQQLSKPTNHDILSRYDPLIYHYTNKYGAGKLFFKWLGTIPQVILLDSKLIKEMLTNKRGEFQKPEINGFSKLFVAGVSSLNGDKWTMHRKIISPAFHLDKLKEMLPSISNCIGSMVSKWEEVLGSKESGELDVFIEFQKLTADIISCVAFGSSYEEGSRVFQLLNLQGALFRQTYYINSFPWLRHFPIKAIARMKEINKEVTSMLSGMIKNRQNAIEMGNSYAVKSDLLGLLLESNTREQKENRDFKGKNTGGMSLDEVIQECKLFYFAGHETTANLLTWTIVVLSMNPEWQQKVREEVLGLVGRDKDLSFDDLSRLKTVTMVLQETLRLYPPSSIVRTTGRKGAKLGDKYIPGGCHVLIPTPYVHRDLQLWGEDILEFNPGRFSERTSKALEKDIAPYFPFGWGPRVCIGQNLSLLEAKMALAMMLRRFSFELSPTYTHYPRFGLTLQPVHGAPIIVRKV